MEYREISSIEVDPVNDSPTYQRIVHYILPEWAQQFRRKNSDYSGAGAEPHQILGAKGQFADIWRKIWKLKKALWDGQKLEGEQAEEILQDLIGHCFLTLDLLRQESESEAPPTTVLDAVRQSGLSSRDIVGEPTPEQDAKDARAWRIWHCGEQCARAHTYTGSCQNRDAW